ncbi:Tyrosine-protein kinase [Cupriavidus sp. U2]|uniref:polysaccharide biosynthesis tyrosine autokinase n=1 Tax=Cupriavidus sp. U2 TaxID=2920269 RepID=UPI00129D50BB|nr:polysaccharide biosynthesis tyrosine autokinase [Cupriavidus sp. U2]KAI3593253.1 Tyrosine-protein kinase [Cupriavidus sp. U2]
MNTSYLANPAYEPAPRPAVRAMNPLTTLAASRWLIVGTTSTCLLAGIAYAVFTRPVYRSDMLIQVEPSTIENRSTSGDPKLTPEIKPDTTSEIQVLSSRMVVSRAVDTLRLHLDVTPRYLPVIGWWLAERAEGYSRPIGGHVYGKERIDVTTFDVPAAYQGQPFTLTLGEHGAFTLELSSTFGAPVVSLPGRVGILLRANTPRGPLALLVRTAAGRPGASFTLKRYSETATTEWLQKTLAIGERGKQSNIIGVSLDSADPVQASRILNEIGREYVDQNVRRRSEEADKSIRFLDEQLPQLKKQLGESESRYNSFRAQQGTVDTSQEARALLQQSVETETRLVDLRQKRQELLTQYTEKHPALLAIDGQLREAQAAFSVVQGRTRQLPLIEQKVLQLQRDMQVDTELYTNRLNARQQLTLVRAGKVANVRLIDPATPPETPIKPRRGVAVAGSLLTGLLAGVVLAMARRRIVGTVQDREEIEIATGIPVYATVPRSRLTGPLGTARTHLRGGHAKLPDAAIESLRAVRTTLHFALSDAPNRVVLITGPTAGVGKSFVAANLATLAGASKRRVLLIDADLRNGVLHKRFRVDRGPGLAEVLAGTCEAGDAIRRDVAHGLDFLSTGALTAGPSELLLQPELSSLVQRVAAQYDMVVLDGPPLLPVADALVLGRLAGTVFMVARHRVTTVEQIDESTRRLAQASVAVRGVIFNDFTGALHRYSYAYGAAESHPGTPA